MKLAICRLHPGFDDEFLAFPPSDTLHKDSTCWVGSFPANFEGEGLELLVSLRMSNQNPLNERRFAMLDMDEDLLRNPAMQNAFLEVHPPDSGEIGTKSFS